MNLDVMMAVAGTLLMLCVYANRISMRYGIPSLLLFLSLGMLAGSDGAGIQFYNARIANYIGTFALAFILFSGGLDTKWNEVRPALARGSLLSTLGVFLTALFLYICAHYILGLSFEVSLLLSVIVSSTDAPAVFSILRSQRRELKPGLKPLLEFESGSNVPTSVFPTCLKTLSGKWPWGWEPVTVSAGWPAICCVAGHWSIPASIRYSASVPFC